MHASNLDKRPLWYICPVQTVQWRIMRTKRETEGGSCPRAQLARGRKIATFYD